ncbi:MAG: GTPase domain-containing protein, partial [Planctomycetota bacterium]
MVINRDVPKSLDQRVRACRRRWHDLQRAPIRLALFGTRNAGKTSLLIALYRFRNPENEDIHLIPDESSMAYLRTQSEIFLQTGSTRHTAAAAPHRIGMRVKMEGLLWNLETFDYSGEALAPQDESYARELRALSTPARKQLNHCDAVLCLHPVDCESLETLDAIDTCLAGVEAPTFFLITKFDKVLEDHQSPPNFNELLKKVEHGNRSIGEIRRRLSIENRHRASGKVLPVSAFGTGFQETDRTGSVSIDSRQLRPINIHAPLKHAIANRIRKLNQVGAE